MNELVENLKEMADLINKGATGYTSTFPQTIAKTLAKIKESLQKKERASQKSITENDWTKRYLIDDYAQFLKWFENLSDENLGLCKSFVGSKSKAKTRKAIITAIKKNLKEIRANNGLAC